LELSGDLAAKMKAAAEHAATELLAKYRWEVFNIHADHKKLFEQIGFDAMTWDSLIHTTYFDYDEIAHAIGDRICAAHSAAKVPQAAASQASP
jgi:hypothetical protein